MVLFLEYKVESSKRKSIEIRSERRRKARVRLIISAVYIISTANYIITIADYTITVAD